MAACCRAGNALPMTHAPAASSLAITGAYLGPRADGVLSDRDEWHAGTKEPLPGFAPGLGEAREQTATKDGPEPLDPCLERGSWWRCRPR